MHKLKGILRAVENHAKPIWMEQKSYSKRENNQVLNRAVMSHYRDLKKNQNAADLVVCWLITAAHPQNHHYQMSLISLKTLVFLYSVLLLLNHCVYIVPTHLVQRPKQIFLHWEMGHFLQNKLKNFMHVRKLSFVSKISN